MFMSVSSRRLPFLDSFFQAFTLGQTFGGQLSAGKNQLVVQQALKGPLFFSASMLWLPPGRCRSQGLKDDRSCGCKR